VSDPRPPEDGLWREETPAADEGPLDQGSERADEGLVPADEAPIPAEDGPMIADEAAGAEPADEAADEGPLDEDYPEFRTPIDQTSATAESDTGAVDEWAVSPDDLLKDLAVPWAPAVPADEPAEPPVEAAQETPAAAPPVESVAVAPSSHPVAPREQLVADPVGADGVASERLIPSRPWLRQGAQAWIGLGPGDTASVESGDRVTPITVIGERVRDPHVALVAPRDRARFEPGARIKPEETSTRGRGGLADEGTVLYRSTRARLAVVSGREREAVHARVDGRVTAVTPGGVAVLVSGWALDGVAGAGQPVHGRLRMGVGDPGDELRSAGLHVADAGSIVVAGARVDVETLTRARALGIHGVITGGIAGHDLRNFQQSEARQQAALHPLPPFAVFALEGFGRRSLAGPPWDLLLAAAGMGVSIFPDPPLLVFAPDADLVSVAPGTVRIVAGPGAGTVGRIDGAAAMHRFDEGVRLLAVPFFGGGRRSIVPLADLERFQ